jgi:gluconolactonase
MTGVEVLASGFSLVEAPCADEDGTVWFSDIYDGGVYRWSPAGIDLVVPKRRAVGGIALHEDGGLVVSGRTVQHVVDGVSRELLRDPSVRMFNDLTVDPQGRVVVGSVRDRTPDGRPLDGPGMTPEQRQRPYGELYRIGVDGAELLYRFDGLSNGLGFSPGGDRLYHVVARADVLVVHDVDGAGELRDRRELPLPEGADGLAVDEEGMLWLPAPNAVRRWSDALGTVGLVPMPAERVISLCFGGPRWDHLFVTTADSTDPSRSGGAVLRTRVGTSGLPRVKARV